MAKEFLHKEGLTKLVENIKAWSKGAFLGKDAAITKSSGANKGVSVSIQGSVSEPSVSVSVTTSGVSGNNSGVVSGSEVKAYVDANVATKDTFKAATSSSNAVNGLVPAPSSANATKFLRGDGTWATSPLATNDIDGLMSAADKTTLDQSVAMVTPITGDDGSCILEVERNDGTFLEFPVPKVGSAKEADNAAKLGGYNSDSYIRSGINTTDINSDKKTNFLYGYNVKNAATEDISTFIKMRYSVDWGGIIQFDISGNRLYTNTWSNAGGTFGTFWGKLAYLHDPIDSTSGSKGVSVKLSGTVGEPKLLTTVTSSGVTSTSETVVLGKEVFDYAVGKDLWRYSAGGQYPYGWFRIAATKEGCVTKINARVMLGSIYTHNPSCSYTIDISGGYTGTPSVTMVSGVLGDFVIPKIRIVRSGLFYYLDIYAGYSTARNTVQYHVMGTLEAEEATHNPSIEGMEVFEFDLADGFKTNGKLEAQTICENGKALSNKYATIDDITNGNITAAKATTADSANAIGGKGLNDLVQGGGDIKHIKVVTSLPSNPSNDTLYLIKQ